MKMKNCMCLWLIFTLCICLAMKLRTVDAVDSKRLTSFVKSGGNTILSFPPKQPLCYNCSVVDVVWFCNGKRIDKGNNDHFKFSNLSLEILNMTSGTEGKYDRTIVYTNGTDQNDSFWVYLSDETRTILGTMLVSHDFPSRGTLNLTLNTNSQLNKPEIISVMKDGKKMCEFTGSGKSVLDTPYKCQLVRQSSKSVTVIMGNVSTGSDFHDVTVKGLFPLEGGWRSYSVAITVLSIVTEFKADNGDIVQGDNVTLSCTVTRGLPSPRIEILKGNEVIKNSTAMETGPTTLKCYFSAISEEARGRYSCQVTIGGYTSKKDYELNVKYPPRFDKSMKEQYECNDTMVTLKCGKADGDPKPKIRLIGPDGKVIDKNPFKLKTFGTYRCEATNSLGNDTNIITVKAASNDSCLIKGKPPSHDGKKGKKDRVIIAVCVVAALLLLTGLVFFIKKRRGSDKGRTDKESLPMTDMSDGYANSVHE